MSAEGIWAFLNSPLAIWFFSAVAIGLISFLYSKRQSALAEKQAHRERSDRINVEIAMRVDYFFRAIKEVRSDREDDYHHWSICVKLGLLDGMPYTAVFEETGQRKMLALLWELRLLAKGSADLEDIEKAIDATYELNAIVTEGWGDQKRKSLSSATKAALVEKARTAIKAFEWWRPESGLTKGFGLASLSKQHRKRSLSSRTD